LESNQETVGDPNYIDLTLNSSECDEDPEDLNLACSNRKQKKKLEFVSSFESEDEDAGDPIFN
jgi:hypothetical protein